MAAQVIDLFLIVFGIIIFINCWKFTEGVNEVIARYGKTKQRNLKYKWVPFAVERDGKMDLWNGFSHVAFTEEGISVSSFWSLKSVLIPWHKLSLKGTKKKYYTNYCLFKIQDITNFTWLLPEKAVNKYAGKWL